MFPGVSSSLVDQNLGLESHTSGVQAQHLAVALRLKRPHSTEDKTSRLILKAALNSQESSKNLAHLQRERKNNKKGGGDKNRNQRRRKTVKIRKKNKMNLFKNRMS